MRQLFVLSLLVMAMVAAGKKCKAPKWQLAMKVVAEIATLADGDLVYDPYVLWDRQAPYNEDVKEAKNLDTSFKGHYKNQLTLNWARKHIQEVKVALLDDKGKELVSLVFDAEGSDNKNWFTKDRLLSSPWEDSLIERQNFFGVFGDDNAKRRWYINRQFINGCPGDTGWLSICSDPTPICSWETSAKLPMLKYSKKKTYTTWSDNENVGKASIFAIFVRTKCPY